MDVVVKMMIVSYAEVQNIIRKKIVLAANPL